MAGIHNRMAGRSGAPLSVAATPGPIYTLRSGTGSATSVSDVAVATGGAGSYTYAWTYVSNEVYTINTPSAASTTFTTNVSAGVLKQGTYRVTATDAASATAFADYLIEFEAL